MLESLIRSSEILPTYKSAQRKEFPYETKQQAGMGRRILQISP